MADSIPTVRLPERLCTGRRGCCVPAAMAIVGQLVEGRDFVIEGWVSFAKGHFHEHTWMEVNGIVFDPTFPQFRSLKSFKRESALYEEKSRFSAGEYQALTEANLWKGFWRNRLLEFGVNLDTI